MSEKKTEKKTKSKTVKTEEKDAVKETKKTTVKKVTRKAKAEETVAEVMVAADGKVAEKAKPAKKKSPLPHIWTQCRSAMKAIGRYLHLAEL